MCCEIDEIGKRKKAALLFALALAYPSISWASGTVPPPFLLPGPNDRLIAHVVLGAKGCVCELSLELISRDERGK